MYHALIPAKVLLTFQACHSVIFAEMILETARLFFWAHSSFLTFSWYHQTALLWTVSAFSSLCHERKYFWIPCPPFRFAFDTWMHVKHIS